MNPKVLITGGSGFVGDHWLRQSPYGTRAKAVSLRDTLPEQIDFQGISSVLHLAGIAHRMDQPSGKIYYEVNRDLTRRLATAAKNNGVPHFVFTSTVKVYGDQRTHLMEGSVPDPQDDYGISKWEAEKALLKLGEDTFKVAIVRPPLVYGPGVKGNIERLLKLLQKGWPLPFKDIKNQRSMVYVLNLTALLDTVIQQQAAGTFVAGDAEPLSTEELVLKLGRGLGKPARLFVLPAFARVLLYRLKPAIAQRLLDDYIIDTEHSCKHLNFTPPYPATEGLIATGKAFKTNAQG